MADGHKPSADEMAIYADYVEAQRIKGESDFARWSRDNVFPPQWDERTAAMRKMIPDFVKSVVDFGCGAMALRAMLPPEFKYIPLDIVSRSPDTVVMD
ncbi:hypothetical protein [Sphingobium cupriresistens]|uniref:Uncharacterized protein n=1 Tax=Sphingobium cupriresistens TaxID=1132417 RepID=A0A8G2DWR5_9SPHN|nr:hypothetical protein [Sphingobium cupriresistens]RYM07981.1 hypothetical protein EWH12_17760 [Sphingobium cupriresistens]